MADLIDRITNEVWSEVADSRDSKWTLRREHIENAVKKAIAAWNRRAALTTESGQ